MINKASESPDYLKLFKSGELERRAVKLWNRLAACDICPRRCGINRIGGGLGYCKSGQIPVISSYCDHHGEEPVISGRKGSGTVFFGNCNLRCVFCQNFQISQNYQSQQKNEKSIEDLAGFMVSLQEMGCHNINLVSPSHFVPQFMKALLLAIPRGLNIPIVYNTNSYDSVLTLRELRGIISIYMPDLKYADDENAAKYSDAPGYAGHARKAIKEMYNQTGDLEIGRDGVAVKGVLVRHLVLPGDIAGTEECLVWLAEEVSTGIGLSLMSQYHPCNRAFNYPELAKGVEVDRYLKAVKLVKELGFCKAYVQGISSPRVYLPDFNKDKPFDN